jgi:hypothetical protein
MHGSSGRADTRGPRPLAGCGEMLEPSDCSAGGAIAVGIDPGLNGELRNKHMAKKDNDPAKWAVIREWDAWAAKNSNDAKSTGGMIFFNYTGSTRRPENRRAR